MMIDTSLFKNLSAAIKCQAVADAAGYRYEFYRDPNPAAVQASLLLGERGITDDTQMALFTIEGMCDALEENAPAPNFLKYIKNAYIRWLSTQTSIPKGPWGGLRPSIASEESMIRVMAPGSTCLSSMRQWARGVEPVKNDRIGCGTVMRQVPFAMMSDPTLAVQAARLTHHGEEISTATIALWDYTRSLPNGINEARYVQQPTSWSKGGWTAMSCAEMAMHSLESTTIDGKPNFLEMAKRAICHEGDSDSVAAIAGALYGWATCTYPEAQFNRLDAAAVIDQVLDRFEKALQLIAQPD